MGVTGNKGIDVRQTANRVIFRSLLQDSAGAIVTSGTTSMRLYELQDDGTLKSYDFNDNTFKATTVTTETANMTHRTGNNGVTNTGFWSYVLSTLTGFTVGAIYLTHITNTGASPVVQIREWQFGGEQGDAATLGADYKVLLSSSAQTGVTIPTVTTLTNAPANSAGTATMVADYARRTDTMAATLADKTGFSLSAAGILAIWNQLTSDVGIITASFAKLIKDNLDTNVGSRSTYAGTDTPGTTTILADYARRSDTLAADLTKIKGTSLSDTLGQVAAAFSKFFNKASPTGTVNSLPDAVAGTTNGLALKSDVGGTITVNASVAVSSAQAANVFEGSLAILAGYTFLQTVHSTVTDDLSTAAKIYFALKLRGVSDDASTVYIEKTAGLTRIKGAAYAYPTDGTILVTGSAGNWDITIGMNLRGTTALLGVNDNRFVAAVKAILSGATTAIPVWEDVDQDGNGHSAIIDGIIQAIT